MTGQWCLTRVEQFVTCHPHCHPTPPCTAGADQLHAVLTRRSKQNGFKEMVM